MGGVVVAVELKQMRVVDAVVQAVVSGPDDIAYLSGSLIEGFGNSASDIDLFLVTAGEPRYGGAIGSVLGDYYLDMELYRLDALRALPGRLNALDAADFLGVWLTPLADLDLYYRTLIGRACHNPDGFEALRTGFRRDVIERLLAVWCGLRCVTWLQHAREELAAGRSVNAALAAQDAAAYALDSYLAAHGESFPSLKWRFEKLARLHGASSNLYRRAWQVKASGGRDYEAYVDDVAVFADELGMRAYKAWSLDDVPLQRTGDSRCFDVGGQRYLVQDRRFIYGVEDGVLEALELIDGRTARPGLAKALGVSGASVSEAIAALQAAGLIKGY